MKEIPFENDMYGLEAAGGARSSVEELLCAAGRTGREEETRTRKCSKRSILLKIGKNAMGLASRRPWQEGGSQESEQKRQRVTFIMLDNFVGRCRLRRRQGTRQVLGRFRKEMKDLSKGV